MSLKVTGSAEESTRSERETREDSKGVEGQGRHNQGFCGPQSSTMGPITLCFPARKDFGQEGSVEKRTKHGVVVEGESSAN